MRLDRPDLLVRRAPLALLALLASLGLKESLDVQERLGRQGRRAAQVPLDPLARSSPLFSRVKTAPTASLVHQGERELPVQQAPPEPLAR